VRAVTIGRRAWVVGLVAAFLLAGAPRGLGKMAPGDVPQDFRSLAGQLLIAAPGMTDPRFRQTVIVMLRHDASGALGIVINRPLAERPLAMLLAAAGQSTEGIAGSIAIHYGGPVEPGIGMMVHSAEYQAADTRQVTGAIAMTGTPDALHDLGQGKGPKRFLFALGYAGWGPGQLEGELSRQDWFTAASDATLVFEADRETLWDTAMARRTRSL
jgi:putative transcriptional regulator